MDKQMINLYIYVLKYNYTIKQSWWNRLKGKLRGRYRIRIEHPLYGGARMLTKDAMWHDIYLPPFVQTPIQPPR